MTAVVASVMLRPPLLWWLVSPFVPLYIGVRRGHPVAGCLCSLVPLLGPWRANRITRYPALDRP